MPKDPCRKQQRSTGAKISQNQATISAGILRIALEAADTAGTFERTSGLTDSGSEFGAGSFAYLLAVLLKRTLDAHDRLSIHTLWRAYGPFNEELVRKTVGQLLGDGYPVSNLAGYLEALKNQLFFLPPSILPKLLF